MFYPCWGFLFSIASLLNRFCIWAQCIGSNQFWGVQTFRKTFKPLDEYVARILPVLILVRKSICDDKGHVTDVFAIRGSFLAEEICTVLLCKDLMGHSSECTGYVGMASLISGNIKWIDQKDCYYISQVWPIRWGGGGGGGGWGGKWCDWLYRLLVYPFLCPLNIF